MFEVIPAIDVAGGQLAVYTPEGPAPMEAYGGDPLAAARAFMEAGARWVHVVDMDLAYEGELRSSSLVEAVAGMGLRVQAGGGVRSSRDVDRLLAAGASRVVLGAAAFGDDAAVSRLIRAHGSRLVLGIEVDDGRIRSRGRDSVDLGLADTLGWLSAAGAARFLVTAVGRVGGLTGPDLELVERVVRSGVPVLAAGGVRSPADLELLRRAGAEGAVIGRAAIEGSVDVAACLAIASAIPGAPGGAR